MNLVDVYGLDARDVEWQDLGICAGMHHDYFFEIYESDPATATQIDEMCASCPVKRDCLSFGLDNKEEGVWGGVYLNGKGGVDANKISHKPQSVQDSIREAIN